MANSAEFTSGLAPQNRASDITIQSRIKRLIVPMGFADGTLENITDKVFPLKSIVKSVFLDVSIAEATGTTKTIDIGTDSTSSGDADGFMVGIDVSTTGLKKGTLVDGGVTLGALLFVESGTGADVANTHESDITSGSKAFSWTPGSTDWAEFKGFAIIEFEDIASKE